MDKIDHITELALDTFWLEVAKEFPEATTGDLSPLRETTLNQAAKSAVREWVNANSAS